MRPARIFALLAFTLAGSAQLRGQERAELLNRARDLTLTSEDQLELFWQAANPSTTDSLWTVSGLEVAQLLRTEFDLEPISEIWVRWVARHERIAVDDRTFAPSFLAFIESVTADLELEDPPPDGVRTTWVWPELPARTGTGTVEVDAPFPDIALAVEVDGQPVFEAGERRALSPGTYTFVARAEGFRRQTVTREVLPGVTTRLSFDLEPVLDEAVARLLPGRALTVFGSVGRQTRCINATPWSNDLAITSLTAVEGIDRLQVAGSDGRTRDAEIIQRDSTDNLAVLRIEDAPFTASRAQEASTPRFGWAAFRLDCDTELDVRLARFRSDTLTDLAAPFPIEARGAPLIDRDGQVIGVVAERARVISAARADELAEAALSRLDRGGFPVLGVTLGATALAALVYLLLPSDPGGDTGDLVIVLPVR